MIITMLLYYPKLEPNRPNKAIFVDRAYMMKDRCHPGGRRVGVWGVCIYGDYSNWGGEEREGRCGRRFTLTKKLMCVSERI